MCENIDWNVGRIVTKVEELGLSENTVIVYFFDNGPNSWRWNGGMKGRKGSTDEGGVRSPLFSYWNGRTSVRSQKFRLDNDGKLYNMEKDSGQYEDVSENFPEITTRLLQAKKHWNAEVLSELPETNNRAFTIGHPDYPFTQIPARDGIAHGNIQRSNRFPNDSFFTNWTSTSDSITWEAKVLADGNFEVEIYYTCPPKDVGAVFELSFSGENLTRKKGKPCTSLLTIKMNICFYLSTLCLEE